MVPQPRRLILKKNLSRGIHNSLPLPTGGGKA